MISPVLRTTRTTRSRFPTLKNISAKYLSSVTNIPYVEASIKKVGLPKLTNFIYLFYPYTVVMINTFTHVNLHRTKKFQHQFPMELHKLRLYLMVYALQLKIPQVIFQPLDYMLTRDLGMRHHELLV